MCSPCTPNPHLQHHLHVQGQHVALIGVQDLIVVASKDGLLVADRARAETIKKLVDGLPAELR